MCVSGRASRENHRCSTTLSCARIHGCLTARTDAFTDCHFQNFTHQLFEIVCSVIWNAEDEIVSPVHAKCFQRCAPVQTRHHRISVETMIIESFLSRTSQTLDLRREFRGDSRAISRSCLSCEGPLVVPRRSLCALFRGRTPPKCQTQR